MRPTITLRKLRAVEEIQKPKNKTPLAIDKGSKFVYSSGSDVMKTFRKYGFVPPSEVRNDFFFKKNREMNNE